MFSIITRMPIFRRLFFAFMFAAVIPGVVITILGFTFVNTLNTRTQAEQVNIAANSLANEVLPSLEQSNSLLNIIYATEYGSAQVQMTAVQQQQFQELVNREQDFEMLFDQQSQQYVKQYQVATAPQMAQVRSILLNDDPNNTLTVDQQQALRKELTSYWPTYKQDVQKVLTAIANQASVTDVNTLLAKANSDYTPADTTWNKIIDLSNEISQQVAQVGPSQINPVILAVVMAFLVTVAAVVTIGYIVNLTITNPLRQLASLTRRIARGETSARARLIGQDEISMVAGSMNSMLDNIVHLIQETQAQRDNLQAQVEKLVSEVSGVGEGDLRIQAEVTADALGVLADSFNYMVEELSSLIVRVKVVATEVENSTRGILDRMNQLVETGDIEIQQIGEAAAEIERMAGSSRQVAESAQALYEVARDARRSAQAGRRAVQQAMSGMGRINDNVQVTSTKVQTLSERSREIEEIVNVIGGIAHQTQRLALDAAIQAAMAGENGKGFAAIATDIRRLSERAKEQAGSITRIVRGVREEVSAVAVSMQDTERETATGAALTREVSVSLEAMFSAVEHQAKAIETMNVLATQQLESSSAVVQVMHGVSEATRQSSISTREASQNMERLARLVEQLRSSVEAFKMREDQAYFTLNPAGQNSVNILQQDDTDGQMSISGLFRTVSASAQLSPVGASNRLPSPQQAGAFPYPPSPAPNSHQNDNGWNAEDTSKQQWYAPPPKSNNGWRQ
jgi:methyl-accepting chemotaxis protein